MLIAGICDDLQEDRTALHTMLREYLAQRQLECELLQFRSGQALLSSFKPQRYHFLFLDIYMPGMSGVEVAARVFAQDQSCHLIFTTTSIDHAIDSYAVRAAGYLVKPYNAQELAEVMDWCLERMESRLQSIEFISNREKVSVPLQAIRCVEVRGRSSIVHTTGGIYVTNKSLSELEAALPASFLRCHRGCIVNMARISKPQKDSFLMDDGSTVPISIDNVNRVKQQYFDWVFLNTWEAK